MKYYGDTMLTRDIPNGKDVEVIGGKLVVSNCLIGSDVIIENTPGAGGSRNTGNIYIAPNSFNNAHNIAIGHGARVNIGGHNVAYDERSSELRIEFDGVKAERNLKVTSVGTVGFNSGRIGQCSTLSAIKHIEIGQNVEIEPGVILIAPRISIAGKEISQGDIEANNAAAIQFRQARQILEQHSVSYPEGYKPGSKVTMNLDDEVSKYGGNVAEAVFNAAQTLGLKPEIVRDGHFTLRLEDRLLDMQRGSGGQAR